MSITTKSKPAWASNWIVSSEGSLTQVPSSPEPPDRASASRRAPAGMALETMFLHPREQQFGHFVAVEIGERNVGVAAKARIGELEHFHLASPLVHRLLELQPQVVEIL